MSKLETLKNEIRSDIINNFGEIKREVLMTLLATNMTLKNRSRYSNVEIDLLQQAVIEIWNETFHCDIEVFSNF